MLKVAIFIVLVSVLTHFLFLLCDSLLFIYSLKFTFSTMAGVKDVGKNKIDYVFMKFILI